MKQLINISSMDVNDLLRTKLVPPHSGSALVGRDALLKRLDKGLEYKLTLLSAPAGFGKTTLVSSWLAARENRQAAWLSLDTGDNDPVRFWRYVFSTCQTFSEPTLHSILNQLQVALQSPLGFSRYSTYEGLLITFINKLSTLRGHHVLVLEDYHMINSPIIHKMMIFLLDHLPATLHLIIITRHEPPLSLARLRAQNELYELHAGDLRFSPEETRTFLQRALSFELSPEIIVRLQERTEGWIAGLRLVVLALQGRRDRQEQEHILMTFSGGHRHILEYLVSEVLAGLSEPQQMFLFQTSILERLTARLCDAVTKRTDGEAMLMYLERAELFLQSLDGAQQWYRYHTLFAEAMQHEARRRFGDADMRVWYIRAARWYEAQGMKIEAIEAMLVAHEFEQTAEMIEQFITPHTHGTELYTIRRWLERLPEELLHARPTLYFTYASALLFTMDRRSPVVLTRVEGVLHIVEQAWKAANDQQRLGELLAFRSLVIFWQEEILRAYAIAQQALTLLPEQERVWRGPCLITCAVGELYAGNIKEAQSRVLEAISICDASRNDHAVRAAIFVLGEICAYRGDLQQATRLFQQVIDEAGQDLSDKTIALMSLARLSLERNNIEEAERQVAQAQELAQLLADEVFQVQAALLQARVSFARGKQMQVFEHLHALMAIVQQRSLPLLTRELRAYKAQFALLMGDTATTQRWYTTCVPAQDEQCLLYWEQEVLIGVRLLIAQGNLDEALDILSQRLACVVAQERTRSEIEIVMLTALTYQARKDFPRARWTLLQALRLAQSEGYRRLFLDEGKPMAMLLQMVLSEIREESLAIYARELVSAFAGKQGAGCVTVSAQAGIQAMLVEPLSSQELRVLRLLMAGLSYPEIAQERIVSVNTVKTQIKSIYRKLNVTSRQEARAAAQQLKLV